MSFYNKKPLEAPVGKLHAIEILNSINKEIDFNRRRAGQVFFFGLVFEVLILAGRDKDNMFIPDMYSWIRPLVYSIFFLAVAAIGITLGTEYRRRIRFLKESRLQLISILKYKYVFPDADNQNASEIQVLYVVLIFLSSCGSILVWLMSIPPYDFKFSIHMMLLFLFLAMSLIGVGYSIFKVFRWLKNHLVLQKMEKTSLELAEKAKLKNDNLAEKKAALLQHRL